MVKISRQTCINDEDLWESKKIGGIRLNPDTQYDADVGEEIIRDNFICQTDISFFRCFTTKRKKKVSVCMHLNQIRSTYYFL